MDILGVGFPELVLIFVIALMVFGPRRLPIIAARVGKTIRNLRQMSQALMIEWQREINIATELEELRKELQDTKEDLQQAKQAVTSGLSTVKQETDDLSESIQKEVSAAETAAAAPATAAAPVPPEPDPPVDTPSPEKPTSPPLPALSPSRPANSVTRRSPSQVPPYALPPGLGSTAVPSHALSPRPAAPDTPPISARKGDKDEHA